MRSLRVQLLVSHLALVLLMAAVTGAAVFSFVLLGRSAGQELQQDVQTVHGAARIDAALAQQREVLALLASGSSKAAAEGYAQSNRTLEKGLSDVDTSVSEPEESALATEIAMRLAEYRKLYAREYASPRARLSPDSVLPEIDRIRALTEKLRKENEDSILLRSRQRRKEANDAIARTVWVTAIAIVVAVLLAVRQNRTAVEPLSLLAARAETIASGDFKVRETARSDEIGALGTALEQMAGRLNEARAESRRRLQRFEQMSDAALEHLYDPVVVLDGQTRLVHLNRAAESLFGALPTGAKVPLEEHVKDRRLVRALDGATGDDTGALFSIKGRTYRLRSNPMTDEEGGVLGSVAVMEDVTELKEVDRLKNEFIGVASHELRTPVASLQLGAEMLQDGSLGELNATQKQVVDMQLDDLARLTKLMQDLLDVTKLESGSLRTERTSVSVEELVRGTADGLRSQAEAKGIALERVGTDGSGQIQADRGQVGRVLTNLVSNAIRHTPRGGRILVRAMPRPDEVTFSVEDTGEGIPAGYLDTIFDRFVQVPGATQGGAGLGLSIAGNIVRAHGGRIWAESTLGEGSRFCFTIPRNAGEPGGDHTL